MSRLMPQASKQVPSHPLCLALVHIILLPTTKLPHDITFSSTQQHTILAIKYTLPYFRILTTCNKEGDITTSSIARHKNRATTRISRDAIEIITNTSLATLPDTFFCLQHHNEASPSRRIAIKTYIIALGPDCK